LDRSCQRRCTHDELAILLRLEHVTCRGHEPFITIDPEIAGIELRRNLIQLSFVCLEQPMQFDLLECTKLLEMFTQWAEQASIAWFLYDVGVETEELDLCVRQDSRRRFAK